MDNDLRELVAKEGTIDTAVLAALVETVEKQNETLERIARELVRVTEAISTVSPSSMRFENLRRVCSTGLAFSPIPRA